MKRLIALSALLAVLLSSAAFGARRDFRKFSLDVPKGWRAEQDDIEHNSRVTLTNGNMIMEIELASRGGKSLEAVAREIAEQHGSSDCEDIEDYYMFTYVEDGIECFGRVSAPKNGMYLLVLICPHDGDEMFDIEESIRVK